MRGVTEIDTNSAPLNLSIHLAVNHSMLLYTQRRAWQLAQEIRFASNRSVDVDAEKVAHHSQMRASWHWSDPIVCRADIVPAIDSKRIAFFHAQRSIPVGPGRYAIVHRSAVHLETARHLDQMTFLVSRDSGRLAIYGERAAHVLAVVVDGHVQRPRMHVADSEEIFLVCLHGPGLVHVVRRRAVQRQRVVCEAQTISASKLRVENQCTHQTDRYRNERN